MASINTMSSKAQYKDFLKSSASFNHKLVVERKSRLPFLDPQTGVAQSDCCLWVTKRDRQLPNNTQTNHTQTTTANSNSTTSTDATLTSSTVSTSGRIYSYPAKRWLKRKRQYLLHDSLFVGKPSTSAAQDQSALLDHSSNNDNLHHNSSDDNLHQNHQNSSSNNHGLRITDSGSGHHNHHPNQNQQHHQQQQQQSQQNQQQQTNNFNNHHSSSNQDSLYNNNNHINHHVNNDSLHNQDSSFMHDSSSNSNAYPWTINEQSKDATTSSKVDPDESTTDNNNDISPYCDFCLGDAALNKKTNKAEELISCSNCGRSGHPTCQGWTQNIIDSVKNYKWQCIECKSCGFCGTSDDDAQLLICDDCDRGYHTYCLNPPLEKVDPDVSWSCSLCIEAYHGKMRRKRKKKSAPDRNPLVDLGASRKQH